MARDWEPAFYDYEAARETVIRIVNGHPVERVRNRRIPSVGQVIAHSGSREAWRVLSIDDVHQANWDAGTTAMWEKAGRPDPEAWSDRERSAFAEPARNPQPGGKDRRGLPIYPWWFKQHWWPLPDPYPACTGCGLLWPCPCHERNVEARKAMKEFDRLAAILPGCCWNCGNPVERRQHSIVFEGDNLLMPGAGPAVFHTSGSRFYETQFGKRSCRGEAIDYEKRWVEAAPGRRPRLACAGTMFRHFGYSECTAGGDCPGEDATHRRFTHCTTGFGTWSEETGAVEVRPFTSCGERGCRGPKTPAVVEENEAA